MSSTPAPKRRCLNSVVPAAEFSEYSWHTFTWINPLTVDGLHSATIDSETMVARRYLDRTPPTTFRLEDSLNTLSFNDNVHASTTMPGGIIGAEMDAETLTLTREQYVLIPILNFL
jgi:hypothetical protein